MSLFQSFTAKVILLNTQVPAFVNAYNAGYPSARYIWADAVRTQIDAANIGNTLLANGVDLPMGLVYQLLTHTDVIFQYAPLF
jgi:hypothetical protein